MIHIPDQPPFKREDYKRILDWYGFLNSESQNRDEDDLLARAIERWLKVTESNSED